MCISGTQRARKRTAGVRTPGCSPSGTSPQRTLGSLSARSSSSCAYVWIEISTDEIFYNPLFSGGGPGETWFMIWHWLNGCTHNTFISYILFIACLQVSTVPVLSYPVSLEVLELGVEILGDDDLYVQAITTFTNTSTHIKATVHMSVCPSIRSSFILSKSVSLRLKLRPIENN